MNNAGGLLGPQDTLAAQQQGLLGLGTGLLSAGGPSRYPISFGQAASGAALQSNAMQNNAIDSTLKRQLVASEIAARLAPPDRKIITVMGPDGKPHLMYETAAMQQGASPYDPSQVISPAQKAQLDQSAANAEQTKANEEARLKLEQARFDFEKGKGNPADAKLDEPYTPAELANLRGPNGEKFNVGTTPRQATAAGAQVVSLDETKQKNAAASAAQALDQLEGMALGAKGTPNAPKGLNGVLLGNPASTPMKALNASGQGLGAFLGTAEADAREQYRKTRIGLAQSLASSESETGVPREGAVERYLALIPDINTPESQARNMFALLRSRHGGAEADSGPPGIKFLGFESAPQSAPQTVPQPMASPFTSVNQFAQR
jgi:hypothetical protein